MKVIKIILFVVIGIIVLVLVVALFVKKEYVIKKEVVINKPASEVFEYLRYLKNQDHYNKWDMADPNMEKKFTGTDGAPGFIYAWNSSESGEGEQELTVVEPNKRVVSELRFIKPFEGKGTAEMLTDSIATNQTKVTWTMSGASPYPMNVTNLFTGDMLGGDLETSLGTLKGVLEK